MSCPSWWSLAGDSDWNSGALSKLKSLKFQIWKFKNWNPAIRRHLRRVSTAASSVLIRPSIDSAFVWPKIANIAVCHLAYHRRPSTGEASYVWTVDFDDNAWRHDCTAISNCRFICAKLAVSYRHSLSDLSRNSNFSWRCILLAPQLAKLHGTRTDFFF